MNLLQKKLNAGKEVAITHESEDGQLVKGNDGNVYNTSNLLRAADAEVIEVTDAGFDFLKPRADITWTRDGITMVNYNEGAGQMNAANAKFNKVGA